MTKYDDFSVKLDCLFPAIFFMVMGMFFGVYIALNGFIFPDYFSGEYMHFGRVRPVHVGNVAFLWLLSANMGFMYYFIPRLCGVPLWSQRMGIISASIWWFALIIGSTHIL